MSADSDGEVSGPVAMMTGPSSPRGTAAIPRGRCVMQRMGRRSRRVTSAENRCAVDRQRGAGRHPAGVGGPHDDASRAAASPLSAARPRYRACRRGTSCCTPARRADRSCGRRSRRTGRISWMTTGMPARGRLPGGLAAGQTAADDVEHGTTWHSNARIPRWSSSLRSSRWSYAAAKRLATLLAL